MLSCSNALPVEVIYFLFWGGGEGGGVLLDTGQMLHLVGGALVVNLSRLTCTM